MVDLVQQCVDRVGVEANNAALTLVPKQINFLLSNVGTELLSPLGMVDLSMLCNLRVLPLVCKVRFVLNIIHVVC